MSKRAKPRYFFYETDTDFFKVYLSSTVKPISALNLAILTKVL